MSLKSDTDPHKQVRSIAVDSVKCTLLGIIYIPYFAQELNSSIFLFCIILQENLIMNPHFYNDYYLFHKCNINNS